jgi:phage-related minor tail protein
MAGRPANLRINVTSDSEQAVRDIGNLESSTAKSLSGLARSGGIAAAAAGAAIGAALIGGIETAVEREKVGSQIAAQLGAGSDDARRYGKLAGKLYSEGVIEDMATAGEAIREVLQEGIVKQGPASEAALEGISRKVADLGTAFGEDVGAVTRAVGQLLRTGLARDADHALDLITKGLTGIANRSDDLLDTVNEYSTQWRDLGITGEQALGLLTQGLQAGARDSDIVADALKELNIRVKDKSAAEALKALGLNAEYLADAFARGGQPAADGLDLILDAIRAIKDPSDQSAAAVAVLGTQSEDLSKALLGLDVTTAVSALGEYQGAAEQVGTTLKDNTNTELQVLIRRLKDELADAIITYALPAVRELTTWLNENLNPALRDVGQWFVDVKNAGAPLAEFFKGDEGINNQVKELWENTKELNSNLEWFWKLLGLILLVIGAGLLATLQSLLLTLSFIVQAVSLLAGFIQSVYDWIVKPGWQGWLERIIGIGKALKEMWDWLSKIGSFDFSDIFSLDIPGVSLSSFSGGGSSLSLLADAAAPPPVRLQSRTAVNVYLDGAPLRAMVRTQVRTQAQQDGARYLAGGWA